MLAELRRIGVEGRHRVINEWSLFLPSNVDAAFSLLSESVPPQQAAASAPASTTAAQDLDDDDDDENLLSGGKIYFFLCAPQFISHPNPASVNMSPRDVPNFSRTFSTHS